MGERGSQLAWGVLAWTYRNGGAGLHGNLKRRKQAVKRAFSCVSSGQNHSVVQVRSICEEMDMDGCARCMPAWKQGKAWGGPVCDVFAVYGWLCVQMPGES